MKSPYKDYFDNLSAAGTFIKPSVTSDMSLDEVIDKIKESSEKLAELHSANDRILREILFFKTPESLRPDEVEQLSELADSLFNYNDSLDVGIAYKIHKLLLDYAECRNDVDLIVRELYYCGVTLIYLNTRQPEQGINLFIKDIGYYFNRGGSYVDMYEQLDNPKTRGYIIRCLGNTKYGIEHFYGSNDSSSDYNINNGWDEYMECFKRTMSIVEDEYYRKLDPEIPWDSFVYSMHYDRTQFLAGLRSEYNPEIAEKVLESAEYIYRNQVEQSKKVKGRIVLAARTQYVYAAARYHAGLIGARELVETLFSLFDEADATVFSKDNIWTILTLPDYILRYAQDLNKDERDEVMPHVRECFHKLNDFLYMIPSSNEHILQISQAVKTTVDFISSNDPDFYAHILNYILACHPPTYIHSNVVALLTKRLFERMLDTRPDALRGAFCMEIGDKNRDAALDLAYHCGLYHDLGKCMLLNYISIYGRRLLDEEFLSIKLHPLFGYNLLCNFGLNIYAEAAFHHHRTFDSAGGYPFSRRNCPEPVRAVVDIITVADSLDAGTDDIGRSYAVAKTYERLVEELRLGSGTRYSPDVVELFDDEDFYNELKQFLEESRRKVYIETYCKTEPTDR